MLIRSRRRTLSLIVHDDGSLEIRCPMTYPKSKIERFIQDKSSWINRKRQENQRIVIVGSLAQDQRDAASRQIHSLFQQILTQMALTPPKKIAIRDQRSRWGSCSSRGHIAINARVASLPEHLQEYVILHELCHLKQMNHGPIFGIRWKAMCRMLDCGAGN